MIVTQVKAFLNQEPKQVFIPNDHVIYLWWLEKIYKFEEEKIISFILENMLSVSLSTHK